MCRSRRLAVFSRPMTWYRVNSSNAANVYTQFAFAGDLRGPHYDAP